MEKENKVFIIEKGIEIPPPYHKQNRSKYPFLEMEVGDSFLFAEEYSQYEYNKARSLINGKNVYNTKNNISDRYCFRTINKQIRVWRTA